MTKGDIFVVHKVPSEDNDVVSSLCNGRITYPVYGIIYNVEDADPEVDGICSEVYTSTGDSITDEWWFKSREIEILEAV